MFYNVPLLLIIEILGVLCILFTYFSFIFLRGDLNISGLEALKIDRLVLQFNGYFVLQVFKSVMWLKTMNWAIVVVASDVLCKRESSGM